MSALRSSTRAGFHAGPPGLCAAFSAACLASPAAVLAVLVAAFATLVPSYTWIAPGSRRRGAAARLRLLPLVCLCAMPGLAAEAPAKAATPPARTVLVLGDSISAAYGMSLEQGWVARLGERLSGAGLRFVNASISGDTSAGGLRRLPDLLAEHQPELVVIELGGNDGLRGHPTTALRDNLEAMAGMAMNAGAEVLILPMEIPPNYGPRYTRGFRAAFRDAAEASGAHLGPFLLDGIATDPTLMQSDGIHPTAEAQPLIADRLQDVVAGLLAGGAGG